MSKNLQDQPLPFVGKPGPGAESLLTEQDVAALTRLSTRTLERRRLDGTGPTFIKLGRRVVYRRQDVDTWIERNRFASTSEAEVRHGA